MTMAATNTTAAAVVEPTQGAPSPRDPFNAHLVALLSVYELGPYPDGEPPVPVPRYTGPSSRETEAILRGLGRVAMRMWAAEGRVRPCGGLEGSGPAYAGVEGVRESEGESSGPLSAAGGLEVVGTSETGELEVVGTSATEELRLLKAQVGDVARVCGAVARGDLGQRIEGPVRGAVMVQLRDVVNNMVYVLRQVAEEVVRVSREVGTEGKLGGQALVPDAEGTWREVTGAVNTLAANLTDQVRCIAVVTTAVVKGDFSQKITVQAEGEMLALKGTVNSMVDQLSAFASEVTRVSREVGTQGTFGGQAKVDGAQGTWADLTRDLNKMASNLTDQVRSISGVTKAVAAGDLTKFVNVDAQGEMLDLKVTLNSMVAQLSTLVMAVIQVSLEVGSEGILGGHAMVPGVGGMWMALTDNVNLMAMNLTNQVRSIARVAKAVAGGDLTEKIDVDARGEILELKETVNGMTESLGVFAEEVTRVAREVGTEGRLGGQARVENVGGTWKDLADNVNVMANNLTLQVRTIAVATTAVARGDFTQKIGGVSVSGEMLSLVNTINDMVDQLAISAAEAEKVACEVGTEGKLGVQDEADHQPL